MGRAVIALFAFAAASWAHHSYFTSYKRERVTLKGQVSQVSFVHPHVMLTIETKNSGTWRAEWTSADAVRRGGIQEGTIKAGDYLEIEGSPARNPDLRVVSALYELRRPADGLRWSRPADVAATERMTIE